MVGKVILGIDPGFGITGFSILTLFKNEGDPNNVSRSAFKHNKTVLSDYGYVKLDSKKVLKNRVGIFYSFFKEKIEKFSVSHVALETPFLGKNAQTFLKLGYLRGILYLLAEQYDIGIHEFSPRNIKMAITGYGGATKEQVALMIFKMFPRLCELGSIEKNDVTDAIAVSICGLWEIEKAVFLQEGF